MRTRDKHILRSAVSFLRNHEGFDYETALNRVSEIISSGEAGNNPVFQLLVEADLPRNAAELDKLLQGSHVCYD